MNTSPGSKITIVSWKVITEHGYFDERAPLGGVYLGSTEEIFRGVAVDDFVNTPDPNNPKKVGVMKMDKDGDFSGIITTINDSAIVGIFPGIINSDNLPERIM